jgi:hypothetical protein
MHAERYLRLLSVAAEGTLAYQDPDDHALVEL